LVLSPEFRTNKCEKSSSRILGLMQSSQLLIPLHHLKNPTRLCRKVVVTFVSSTNKGRAANIIRCSTLFSSLALDQSTRCIWTDSLWEQWDELEIGSGSLESFCTSISEPCSSWKSNTAQNLTVALPPDAISAAITISVPSHATILLNLAIDLTASSGNGGRS
jgi:hypothetical protein